MAKKVRTLFCLISIVIMCFITYNFFNNDYMTHKDRNCVVLDKIQSNGGYKYPGNFYLILKEERGIVFDIIVDAATYTQSKIGQNITFSLRQHDIKQTQKENILYFFGPILFLMFTLFVIMLFLIDYLNK